jgi:hypothetical protein
MTMAGDERERAGLVALATLILIAMTFVFAQLIGWRALARRYGSPRGTGTRYPSKGVLIGAHSWNAPPLSVALDELGITLLPKSPFRFAFVPLRIAWPSVVSFEARSFAFFEAIDLRFGDGASLISFVPSQATDAIATHLASQRGFARDSIDGSLEG